MKSDDLKSDVELSKNRWESIYKNSPTVEYKKDTIVLSYKSFLDKYKNDFNKGVFLDLGCGIAFVSALLAKEKTDILGIDISKEAIDKSKELFAKEKIKGRFIQADLLDLPLNDESVQFIWSCMSLEYVKNTSQAVGEAYRVLKRGGKMIAVVPVISLTTLTYHQLRGDIPNLFLVRSFMEWLHLKVFRGKYMHYGYEQSFTPGLLKRIFSDNGFKIIKIDYFDMYYPVEFVPKFFRSLAQKLLRLKPFWPLVYIEVIKE